MPNDQTYTKEPWTDSLQAPALPAGPVRQSDLEVKEYETHARPRAPSRQPDKVEGTAAEGTKPTEETVKLSPQVTALARKEAKFRQEQAAFKAEREKLEADKAELAELKALKAKLEAKDYSGIEGLVSYDEFTQYQMEKLKGADPQGEAIKKLAAEVESIKKSSKDNLSQQFEAAVKERRDAVTKLVEADPEFSTIKELKRHDAVVQHILDTWEHDEIDLPIEQAAKEVEELLVEEAKKYASLSKIRPPAEDKKTLPPMKPNAKTITNQMTVSDAKTPLKPLHFMSESERYAEARRRAVEKLEAQKAAKTA